MKSSKPIQVSSNQYSKHIGQPLERVAAFIQRKLPGEVRREGNTITATVVRGRATSTHVIALEPIDSNNTKVTSSVAYADELTGLAASFFEWDVEEQRRGLNDSALANLNAVVLALGATWSPPAPSGLMDGYPRRGAFDLD